MTSKTSCFDSAIFKRSLRKTLPLWACYFLFWLFTKQFVMTSNLCLKI